MSFGVSIGDVFVVGKFVKDIVSCLQSSGGARSTYRELVRDMKVLENALCYIDDSFHRQKSARSAKLIGAALLTFREPLQGFWDKMNKKYEHYLAPRSKSNMLPRTVAKLEWSFKRKTKSRLFATL
jgi:hypothetical protein